MPRQSSVSLTPKQQTLVDRLVQTGRFHGASDVVATGLRLLEDREKEAAAFISTLEAEIEIGLKSGDSQPMESAEALLKAFKART